MLPLRPFVLRQAFKPLLRTQYKPSTFKATFGTSSRIMAQEFKLKELTGINLKNGQKQECEIEGIENGKVLLAKVNGEVHAMSPNCTHYGAPLVKGVLTPEGRLTCPWHGGG